MGTSNCEVSCLNVAFLENTLLILDIINKENKKVVVSSFQNDFKTKGSARDQSKAKEEDPLSLFAHQGSHAHVFRAPFSFLWEGRGHMITTIYEDDVEFEDVGKISYCIKEEFVILPRVCEEWKASDASFPPLLLSSKDCSIMFFKILFQFC